MNTALHCKRMVGGIRRDIVNEGRYANSRGKPNGFDAAVFGTPGETRTHYIPLRSSPPSDIRESNQYKKVLILSGFSEVLLSIRDKL